jgi:hypothetical protein
MKKILSLFALAALFALSGCDAANNAVFKSSEVAAGTVQQDSIFVDGKLVALTPELRALVDPAKVIKAGTPVTENRVEVAPAAKVVVNAIKFLPIPYADVASYALNGLLVIAAGWLTKGKSRAEKINTSLVKGVDTFRDILDQTEVGAKLDEHLTTTLRQQQEKDGVQAVVKLLVERYATPPKPPASALTAAALKAAA